MSALDRLQPILPFLGGLLVLFIGEYFDTGEVALVGLGLTLYGFYHMVRGAKGKTDQAD